MASSTQLSGTISTLPFNTQSPAYQAAIQQMAAAAKLYQQGQISPQQSMVRPGHQSYRGVADMYRSIEAIRGGPLTAYQREQVNWFWNNHNRFPAVMNIIEKIRVSLAHQHDICSDIASIDYSYGDARKTRHVSSELLVENGIGTPMGTGTSWLPFMLYVSEKLDNPSRPRPSRAVMAPPEADKLCRAIKPLYRGEPSRAAMYLLRGTLTEVVPDKIKGPNRVEMNCRWPLNLMSAGYMRQAKTQRHSFTTKAKGIELMEGWAKKNKVFRKFFEAYVPAGAHDRAVEREVLEVLQLDD